ncbi:MAG: threonine/serine dehydratase [Gemmatimonadaceae bacterium]|nr:threonine/serine dehydratase [Gemmatimonadaceae bacterium]
MPRNPITFEQVLAARERLRAHLTETPARRYPLLDALVGHDVRVVVKHENHLPIQSFKVRNATSAMTALDAAARARGVIAASTGNHGQGLAWAGARLGVPVTIVVPEGNNPDKGAAIRAMGATLIETGATYDAAAAACATLAEERGMTLVHSTNNADVVAGAATITLEFLEQVPELDTIILALGGGSQTVGAIVVRDAVKPSLRVIGAQSEGAKAQYESWRERQRLTGRPVRTIAEDVATGRAYELTFDALVDGMNDCLLVSDAEIADAIREMIRCTKNLPEAAGAIGLATVRRYAERFAGQTVGIVLCGGNLDGEMLRRVMNREL